MNPTEFISDVVSHLREAGLPYMIVGSVASNAYGEVRTTFDTDIVVDAPFEDLLPFLRSLGEEYYVDEEMAREAWERRRMFNIIHFASGNKADIICRKDYEYACVAFGRRRRRNVEDVEVQMCTPEDVILSKLQWSKMGESERQYRDALGVAKTQRSALDLAYLAHWAEDIGVADLLNRLLRDSELSPPPATERSEE